MLDEKRKVLQNVQNVRFFWSRTAEISVLSCVFLFLLLGIC